MLQTINPTAAHPGNPLLSRAPASRKVYPLWGFEKPGPLPWAVQHLVPKGYMTILQGDGGVGKSLLAMYLALCIATGRQFFGLQTEKSVVLYVDYELDVDEQKRRCWRIAEGMDMTVHAPELAGQKFYFRPENFLSRPGGVEEVQEKISEVGANVIVLDSLSIGMGGANISAAQKVNKTMGDLRRWGTVIALDHISKSGREEGSRATPFGSIFKRNHARSTLNLGRDTEDYVLTPDKSNFGPGVGPIKYGMNFDEGEDTVRFSLAQIGENPVRKVTPELTFRAILAAYQASNSAVSPLEAVARLELDGVDAQESAIRNHFTTLVSQGRIMFDPLGARAVPVKTGVPREDTARQDTD